ncbi:MAG: hypothetical protein HPY89_05425 [Pelotomaculum sp.]|uniref:Uncharacterized protein n=1 Tax=Pelotomaculum thermopropionicum (strain DSM 13744 / JCM 10971 / SI) TaxID=370438 RepID=A5D1N0_PELTS|nr:hypothetical protein [Pelotomaculum sp.]BAF59867.1 hypothetical protein PTH_1686 [Pelotomaculum thermopropionicum SI]
MEFDFRDAFSRIGLQVVEETNKRIKEMKENMDTEKDPRAFTNIILNEMINDNIRITLRVLEEYHRALMKFISEKGV